MKKPEAGKASLPVVFCAIDTPDLQHALRLSAMIARVGAGLKLGLEFFNAQGPQGVRAVLDASPGLPLFLDLKYHDIPNTVAQAVRSVVPLGATYINVHASGGGNTMKAAKEAAVDEAAKHGIAPPRILGVTVLTSISQQEVGFDIEERVVGLTEAALECKLDGVVCSAREIEPLRNTWGPSPVLMVPGIRPAGHVKGFDDQARTMTPREAMQVGATHLVIGRPITGAPDPEAAARAILAEIDG